MSDPAHLIARVSALLGPADGAAVALDGGITNRNWKVNFAGKPHVIREPGKDTELLGIDRKAEWAASCAAARTGVGPPVRAMLDNPPILVTAFVEGTPVTEEELRKPDLLWNVAGALRRIHDSEEEPALEVLRVPGRRGVRRHHHPPGRHGARRLRRRPQAREGDREGAARARARAGALPQRPAGRQPAAGGIGAADPRLGVRGHGRSLLRPGQPRGEQRPGRGSRGHPAGGLLRRGPRCPPAGGACG